MTDDGKRLPALDVVLALLLAEKFKMGEGSGGGWAKTCDGAKGWIFGFCMFYVSKTLVFATFVFAFVQNISNSPNGLPK